MKAVFQQSFHPRAHLYRGAAFALLCMIAGSALPQEPASKAPASKPRAITTRLEGVYKHDFDGSVEHRTIRVAAPYSRSLYFNDKGRERGLSADFMRDFERYINQKYVKQLGKRPITAVIRPTTRDKLLQEVVDGYADIAVGNLTITDERLKLVDFVTSDAIKPVSELVVTGPKSQPVASAEELSGKKVHVRKSSSYYDSLIALNDRLKKAGKPPATLVTVPDALEDEDMMEMLNAGLLEAIIVDDWKARMWAQVLPKIKVNEGAAVREGGKIGWAIRKGSPKLKAELDEFIKKFLEKQGVYNSRMKQYNSRIKQLKDPTGSAERKRFEETIALFEKYGKQYHFDPLMLAAQGYQESQLNQNAKSHVGAIGIMQIMPATGKELNVGDIHLAEPNVHGGSKYMDRLMTKYFPDAKFDDVNRTLFAFASYNCGPGNVSKMRKEAAKRGLDPDRWFNNVELVTAEKIGAETTTYVRNIFKYYVAYRLMLDIAAVQDKARETVKSGK